MTNSVMDTSDHTRPVGGGDRSDQGLDDSPDTEELWDADFNECWNLLDPRILASMLRNGLDKVGKLLLLKLKKINIFLIYEIFVNSVSFVCVGDKS